MSQSGAVVTTIRDRIGSLPGWGAGDIVIDPAIPILASPSWRGVDGFPWRAIKKSNGESIFIKVMDHTLATLVPIKVALISHEAMRGLIDRNHRIAHLLWRDSLVDAAIFRKWIVGIGLPVIIGLAGPGRRPR